MSTKRRRGQYTPSTYLDAGPHLPENSASRTPGQDLREALWLPHFPVRISRKHSGTASMLFGTASMLFGTAPMLFGTAPMLFRTASMLFRTASMLFGTASMLFGTASMLFRTASMLFGTASRAAAREVATRGKSPPYPHPGLLGRVPRLISAACRACSLPQASPFNVSHCWMPGIPPDG